jgi:predicted ATP-dependent endonuclease of OLD family
MTVEMINKRLKIIEDLQEELRRIKALYAESLDESDEFQEIEEEAKKFRQESKEKKERVLEKPEIKEFKEQIQDTQRDIKDQREVLSMELAEHYKESGSIEITDSDGNKKRMVFNVKLIDID